MLYEPDFPQVFGNQYEPFVIPCKPTAPHIKVELVNEDGEVIYNNSMCDQEKGFEVIFNETHEEFITCRVLSDSQNFIDFFNKVNPRTSKIFFSNQLMYKKIFNQKII